MAENPGQAVTWEIADRGGTVVMRFRTDGASPLEINVDPQAAFEIGEQLARAAHVARFGQPAQSDASYLHQQIKARVTEELRMLLVRREALMLNSLRTNPRWSNEKLAAALVDTILTQVA